MKSEPDDQRLPPFALRSRTSPSDRLRKQAEDALLYSPIQMPTKLTLLCIDDEENGLKMRKWLFETEGFQVFTASDGPTGIELFKNHSVDGVVLDYSMPGMDGLVVAERLKTLRQTVPIIMLSGYPVPAEANQSIDALITKGESPAHLLTTTASLLRTRSHSHPELDGKYVAFVDEQRKYLDVTDGVCELLGYSRSELLAMRIDEVTAPEMRSNTRPLFEQYLQDGLQRGSYILLHRNGNEIPITYIARAFPDGCLVASWHPKGLENQKRAS
jgi:PAS domain S-box-containing protein